MPNSRRFAGRQAGGWSKQAARQVGPHILGWRTVPINLGALGDKARDTMPEIRQILVVRPGDCDDAGVRAAVVSGPQKCRGSCPRRRNPGFYIPSFSSRTIVYKGLLNAPDLAKFLSRPAGPVV